MSFDSILLSDLGTRTQVLFLIVDVQMRTGAEEYRERRKAELEGGRELLNGYFQNLKQRVESAS